MKSSVWLFIAAVMWLVLAVIRLFVTGADGGYYFDLGASLFFLGMHPIVRELELSRARSRD